MCWCLYQVGSYVLGTEAVEMAIAPKDTCGFYANWEKYCAHGSKWMCKLQGLSTWSLGISGNLLHPATRQHLGVYFKLELQKVNCHIYFSNMFSLIVVRTMRTEWPFQPLLPHGGLCWQIDGCLVYYTDERHGGIRAGPMVYRASWRSTKMIVELYASKKTLEVFSLLLMVQLRHTIIQFT